jgi:hypothetical protein
LRVLIIPSGMDGLLLGCSLILPTRPMRGYTVKLDRKGAWP